MYQFYGGMTGNLVATTPSANLEAVATKATANAKVLLGSRGTTGTMTLRLNRLDTVPGLVTGGRVRVIVQRVPDNGGGAVTGPAVVTDTMLSVSGDSVSVSVPWTNTNDGYTVTLQP